MSWLKVLRRQKHAFAQSMTPLCVHPIKAQLEELSSVLDAQIAGDFKSNLLAIWNRSDPSPSSREPKVPTFLGFPPLL